MHGLRNVKIKIMMVSILILFTLLWCGAALFSLHALGNLKNEVALTNTQQANGDIINSASDRYYRVKLLMERAMIAQGKGDQASYQKAVDIITKDIDFLQAGLDQFKMADHANISRASIDNIYDSSLMLFTQAIRPMFEVVKANNVEAFSQLSRDKYNPLRTHFSDAIVGYNQEIHDIKESANERISYWVSVSRAVIIMAVIAGLVMLILSERYLSLFLGRPLKWVEQHLQVLSQGHLDKPVPDLGNNEVGHLVPYIETMQQNWIKTVSQIRRSAEAIYHNASEIAAGNMDLSSRTEEQAAALTQTAASMEQLSAVVKQNADNAAQASTLAQTASKAANEGGEVVHGVISSMENITGSSQKIADIINVIDSIAFQTNILALNAAVEAARAGEQGRGFAVVASEVRNLAQRSANAAKEIKVLIDESVSNVSDGYERVSLANTTMDNILTSVSSVTRIMSEIASASFEQSQGISQVGSAISQMDTVTQQNAALVEESSGTSTSLEEQSHHLTGIVSTFTLPGDDAARQNTQTAGKPPLADRKGQLIPASSVARGYEGRSWESF